MNLRISGLFRSDHINHNPSLPPSKKNPGGGVATYLYHLRKALPTMQVISDIAQAEAVNLTESLWFSETNEHDSFDARVKRYVASKVFKILKVSDVEFMRWQGHEREEIFDATDVVIGNSIYMVNLLKAFISEPVLLTDPTDVAGITSVPQKKHQIFGMSNVSIEKGIGSLVKIFEGIPEAWRLERMFIGGSDLWGLNIRQKASIRLERELSRVCDIRHVSLPYDRVAETIAPAWGYVADTGYDTFCYAMVEAMLAGCWCFCGRHLIYDERPCVRFDSPADAVIKIGDTLEREGDSLSINEEGRQYAIDHYSLDVFRRQLAGIIGGSYGL